MMFPARRVRARACVCSSPFQVSNKMASGEWVYLCVQDLQTGHVITLHDNRAMLIAQAQAGSDEEKNAFRKMLGQ